MRLVTLALVFASGCTHLVWYGRSDDRRHVVSVIEQSGDQHVRLDMRDEPKFLGVGVDALGLTNKGHLAYPAQVREGWLVVHDGKNGPVFDAIGEVQLTNEHLAYTAEKSGKWHVVHDGVLGEAFDTVLPGSLQLQGSRIAFAAQQGLEVFAIIDGQRSAPMDGVGLIRFSRDGTRAGFVGKRLGASYVVLNSEERGPFESVAELHPGTPDLFVARTKEGWRVFNGDQPGEPYEKIAGLIEGPAYGARRDKETWVIDGAVKRGPFTSLKSQLMRDVAGKLVFAAQTPDSWVVMLGDRELRGWEEVETPVINGSHIGFIGERNGRYVVSIDGEERSTWEWASSLALSGERVAHLARRTGRTFVVLDGKELTFDVVVAGTLAFSKDGKRFGCITGDATTRKLFITRDDGARTQVDMEELVAALSRGNQDSLLATPDVTLLRRWVEAELEH